MALTNFDDNAIVLALVAGAREEPLWRGFLRSLAGRTGADEVVLNLLPAPNGIAYTMRFSSRVDVAEPWADWDALTMLPVQELRMARVYALAGGDSAVNTHERLLGAAAGGAISEQSARDLRDALEFLAFLRIQHQSRQIAAGQNPDNFLNPDEISNFERAQLKDAFAVVASLQGVLAQRYRM